MAVNKEIPPIHFVAGGNTPEQQENNLELVLPSPGFPNVSYLIADAIQKRSELTLLDFTQNQTNIRCQIDGVWHGMPPMDRETSDYMLAALKQLAGMNYRERRLRQEGRFRADYLKRKTTCRIISQGVRTGERVAIYLDIPRPPLETLEDLGMRPSMRNQLASLLEASQIGMTLVSAMPNEGFTSLWRGVLTAADRFTRDYYVIEEKTRVEPDVINVSSVTYDEAAGETAFTRMPQLLLREPNFIAFTEIPNARILDQICSLTVQEELPVLARIHGKNALDGLLRLMALKSDQQKLVDTLQCVVAMRIVRKLCQECRVGFRPNPMLLQKLGLPPGRINLLYKPFVYQPEMVDEDGNAIEICSNCRGIGYFERTGIFELFVINDAIRKLLRSSPNLNQLAAEVRKHNHISMREEGVVLVAKGLTSLEELQRMLKA